MSRIGSLKFVVDRVVWDASSRKLAIINVSGIDERSKRVSENLTFGPDGLVASTDVFHGVTQ